MPAAWTDHPYTYNGYLWLYKPEIVFCATLDRTTTIASGYYTGTDIIQYLFFDTALIGAVADVKEDMTLALGSTIGGWDRGWVRLRGTTTYESETVLIVWASSSAVSATNPGRAGELNIYTDTYITVFNDHRVWAKMPFLDTASGYWDGSNGAGGTVWKQFPVANAGTMRCDFATAGARSFTLSGANSFAVWNEGYLGTLTADAAYTITASSENGTHYDDNAFDGDGGTYWESVGSGVAYLDWYADYPLRAIDITAQSTTTAPKTFVLYRYHITLGYVPISTYRDETGWSAGETRRYFFDCAYPGPGTWDTVYRLLITDNNGAATHAIRDIDIFYADRATSPYTWDVADCTITTGSATTESITLSCPVGFRYIELSVEDAASTYTGETHTPVAVLTLSPTNNTSITGTSAGASTADPSYPQYNIFDGNTATSWRATATTGWIRHNGAAGTTINANGYRLYAKGTSAPRDWTCEGSADASTWHLLDTQVDQSFDAGGEWKTYDLHALRRYRYMRLNITDNNGAAYVEIFEFYMTMDQSPYKPLTAFNVTEQRLSQQGQRMGFDVFEDISESDYPPGTLVCYFEREVLNGVVGSLSTAAPSGRTNVKFWGWLDEAREVIRAGEGSNEKRTQLAALDVGGRLGQLPGFPFVIENDYTRALPAYYNQMAGACIDRLLYLMARWLSNAAEITDFLPLRGFSMWVFPILEVGGSDLWEMMRGRAEAALMRLGCTKWGSLAVYYDYQIQTTYDLPAPKVSIGADDIVEISYTSQPTPRLHWNWSAAVAINFDDPVAGGFTVTSYRGVAPGNAPGQGVNSAEQNEMLVRGQDDMLQRGGQTYAYQNAALSRVAVTLAHGADTGLDPAQMQYIAVTLSADYAARRGITWATTKMWLYEMDIRHITGHTKDVIVYLEPYIDAVPSDVITD